MRAASLFVACIGVVFATAPFSAPADAKVRVVPFTKSGAWSVRAVYGSKGPFDHCSANTRYQSGTRVSIIVYRSGNWRLWFSHDAWPDRGRATFPAAVEVDGRVVLNRNGRYKGRSAYIDLGPEVSRVKALMRGRAMAIRTPAGTSRFKLTGTNRATRALVRCWKAHYRRPSSNGNGAFGSANNDATGGAFSSGAVRRKPSNQLSRASTLELATRYLSKARQSYSILPREKAPLKNFPVNWRMRDGTLGGMRVFRNTNVVVGKVLDKLLSEQAKNCRGRNASQRDPERKVRGRNYAKARGVCETSKGTVINLTYKVVELGRRMVMVVMELESASKGKGTSVRPGKAAGKKELPGNNGDELRVPGPNEL